MGLTARSILILFPEKKLKKDLEKELIERIKKKSR